MSIKYNYKPILDLKPEKDEWDLVAAASGYGGYCPEGIPAELAILGLLGAFAVAFGVLYRAVTLKTGGRRKRRDTEGSMDYVGKLQDFIWIGELMLSRFRNENQCKDFILFGGIDLL